MKPIQVALTGFFALCTAITPWAVAADSSKPQAEGLSFQHKDWELVCDNTRTCRAAGYQSEGTDSAPVSMLIEREAGPNTSVQISIQLGGDAEPQGPISMTVGKLVLAKITQLQSFEDKQVRALLPVLLKNETAAVTADKDVWTLSLQGLRAVLLKMDEFQGRLNTAGALVQRGNRPETDVKPALAKPEVSTVVPVSAQKGDQALIKQIFPLLQRADVDKRACNNAEDFQEESLKIHRLIVQKVLLSFDCPAGAYNQTTLNWISNDKQPFQPKKIKAEGEFDSGKGTINGRLKRRGVGDCVWLTTWSFTGNDFDLTEETSDTMCRGFGGGAWNLLHYTARPIAATQSFVKPSQKP